MEKNSLIHPKIITKEILDYILKKMVEKIHPEKIILFGSNAKGNSTVESDLDLAIIIKKSSVDIGEQFPLNYHFQKLSFQWILSYIQKAK